MGMTRDIRIKVTPLQYEIIKNKAQINGFKTVSSFIRSAVFDNDNDSLLKEIYDIVKSKKEVNMDLREFNNNTVEMEA